MHWVLPDLATFDVRLRVVHGLPVPMSYVALAVAYAGLYVSALLVLGTLIFSRRDFK
jgi:hypothetical protein